MKLNNKQKKILIIVVAVIAIVLLLLLVKNLLGGKITTHSDADFSKIVENAETKIVYVENSDSKKCKNCEKIKKHLDKQNIEYSIYNVNKYSDKEYTEMLKSIEINPDDFSYPAVIYMKDGKVYSNVINISDTTAVDNFIKTYGLTNIK